MRTVSILDTSIASPNLGDQIIIDAVKENLNELFHNTLFIHFQTQDVISKTSYRRMEVSDFIFVGGTNLLSSNMNFYNQWKISLWDSFFLKDVILMGVGWWQYQEKPNFYTSILYKKILDSNYLHSVRDNYTKNQLELAGVKNVINTSCPTMWSLNEEHCSRIPQNKSDAVLVTFTEYKQNESLDSKIFTLLEQHYEQIYFWTQQPGDYEYMYKIAGDKITYVRPNVRALDEVLELDIDYVGTRLHAGIRALQHRKRTLILAVDNRATEISKDTNLSVAIRDDLEHIKYWIYSNETTKITLPWENIDQWKKQFK
jgi:Polysaccharide pyruvyl transferase